MAFSQLFSEERQQQIMELLQKNGRVTVRELCEKYSLSTVTVRNDLKLLETQGKLVRTHGGALGPTSRLPSEIPFVFRQQVHSDAKRRIAQAASELVADGEAVFIDGGTTASLMRYYLDDKRDLTLITPSIEVAHHLSQHPSMEIFVLGGVLKKESCSTLGASSADSISSLIIRKGFYGAYGLTLAEGLTDVHAGFIEQKRMIAARAQVNIGLVDSSKWGKVSIDSFLPVKAIDVIVTDKDAPQEMVDALKSLGIELLIA